MGYLKHKLIDQMIEECGCDPVVVSVANGDRGRVYDSSGLPIAECIEANLNTGRCVVFHRDKSRRLVIDGDEVMRRTIRARAPLSFYRKVSNS